MKSISKVLINILISSILATTPGLAITDLCQFLFFKERLSAGDIPAAYNAFVKLRGKMVMSEIVEADALLNQFFGVKGEITDIDQLRGTISYKRPNGEITMISFKSDPLIQSITQILTEEISETQNNELLFEARHMRSQKQNATQTGNILWVELSSQFHSLGLPPKLRSMLLNSMAGSQALALRITKNAELFKTRLTQFREAFKKLPEYDPVKDTYDGLSWNEVQLAVQKFSQLERAGQLVTGAENFYKNLFQGRPELYEKFAHTHDLIPLIFAEIVDPNPIHASALRKHYITIFMNRDGLTPRQANERVDALLRHVRSYTEQQVKGLFSEPVMLYIIANRENLRLGQ